MKNILKNLDKTTSRMAFLLLLLLVLPILIYSVYQVVQRSQDEQMIRDIYRRQLDVILFSVNQYCWNQYQMWEDAFFNDITTQNQSNESIDLNRVRVNLNQKYPSIAGVFIKNENETAQFSLAPPLNLIASIKNQKILSDILSTQKNNLNQQVQNAKSGYWRPVIVNWNTDNEQSLTLFILPMNQLNGTDSNDIGGIFLNAQQFIQRDMNQQFQSVLTENANLLLGVFHNNMRDVVYSTDEELRPPFDRTKDIWLLPDYQMVIKAEGTSLSSLARNRMWMNYIFLILINCLVISGIIIFLKNMNQQIRLAQMKTDFVANVSHELRTPLALIRMYTETLEMGRIKDNKKIKYYYHTIINESQRLSQLINNILDFSRIESKRKRYEFQLQQIQPAIEEVLSTYEYQFKKLDVDLKVELTDKIPDLYIDKASIIQVMLNLIDNALKFSPDKISIHIILEKKNQEVELCIRDKGIGISNAEQKLIFQKFYRSGSTLVHETKGSGLGLTLVEHIMDVHKGKILVESRIGEGSCFKLYFPIPAYPSKTK